MSDLAKWLAKEARLEELERLVVKQAKQLQVAEEKASKLAGVKKRTPPHGQTPEPLSGQMAGGHRRPRNAHRQSPQADPPH